LLAASRSGWRTVASLIRLGADIQVKDSSKRNVLHLVVMYGGRLDEFAHEITMVILSPNDYKLKNHSRIEIDRKLIK